MGEKLRCVQRHTRALGVFSFVYTHTTHTLPAAAPRYLSSLAAFNLTVWVKDIFVEPLSIHHGVKQDGFSSWCLVRVCLICIRVQECVCVRVISWYGIYTQTVYTTHTPHIDSVHPFNTRQRKHLCGKTFTFCSDDCLLSEVLYSHTLTLTHTHSRICGVR